MSAALIFRGALAAANAAALTSWLVQWRGLIGSAGILPASQTLRRVRERTMPPEIEELATLGSAGYWKGLYMSSYTRLRLVPSIFSVIGADDWVLELSFYIGYACCLFLTLDLWPVRSAALFAFLWLSHLAVSKPWLSLQMDSKLVETNALFALTYAFRSYSPTLWVWAMRWLAFRIMVACGCAKWTGGDASWKDLGRPAMQWHYFTQPLPNALSRAMHYLPVSFHGLEVIMTYVVEVLVPFAYGAASPALRGTAFLVTLGFNAVIGATGNYGHLHLLMLAISTSVLADTTSCSGGSSVYASPYFSGWGWAALQLHCPPPPASLLQLPLLVLSATLGWVLFGLYFAVSLVPLSSTLKGILTLQAVPPGWDMLQDAFHRAAKLSLVNHYSKFTHMTKFRWELQLEGTMDGGRTWIPFGYLAKPGGDASGLSLPPATLLPGYRPTLDWRCWFVPLAAARAARRGTVAEVEPWYRAVEEAILRGSPSVLDLFHLPPALEARARGGQLDGVRTVIHDYRFTEPPGWAAKQAAAEAAEAATRAASTPVTPTNLGAGGGWSGLSSSPSASDPTGASPQDRAKQWEAGAAPGSRDSRVSSEQDARTSRTLDAAEDDEDGDFDGIRSFINNSLRQRLASAAPQGEGQGEDQGRDLPSARSTAVSTRSGLGSARLPVRFKDDEGQGKEKEQEGLSSAFTPTDRRGGRRGSKVGFEPSTSAPGTPFPLRREGSDVVGTGLTPAKTPARPRGGDAELVPDSWYGGAEWEVGTVWSRRFVMVYDIVARQGCSLVKQALPIGRMPGAPGRDLHALFASDSDEE